MRRMFIPAFLQDNTELLKHDPDYAQRLEGLGDPALVKAMLEGDWDVVSGGALDDVWDRKKHQIKPFKIPFSWYIDRTMDWGSSKPYSVCYWAESDGTTVKLGDGTRVHYPRGTIFQIGELYGSDGKDLNVGTKESARELGNKMREYEEKMWPDRIVNKGAADGQIFEQNRGGTKESIHDQIVLGYKGLKDNGKREFVLDKYSKTHKLFYSGNKSPGSRKRGLELVRNYLKASKADTMEEKGIFFFDNCRVQITLLPILPRSDKDSDDVDTDAIDHAYDALRYRIFTKPKRIKQVEAYGI